MNIDRAREILGYVPEKGLSEAIREYGEWWRREQGEKAMRRGRGKTGGERGKSDEKRMENEEKKIESEERKIESEEKKIEKEAGNKDWDEAPGKVCRVTLYHCGYCTNNLAVIFRGLPWEKRDFPALAVLIRHRDLGNILYDTGYSEEIFQKGIFLWLYRLVNPVSLKKEDRIDEKLAFHGISPESIRTILLSHNHPDHTGGLSRFPEYELIALKEVSDRLPSLPNIKHRWEPGLLLKEHFLCEYFDKVYDLFGDGSLIGIRLDGHCKGQMGLWIPDFKLFLAADACWGADLVRHTLRMRLVPRFIHKNFSEYKQTLHQICRMKKDYPEIKVVFSHQKGGEKVYG